MQEDKKKKKKKLSTKWKLTIGICICLVFLISSWILGQRFESIRSAITTITQPIQRGYLAAENWVMDILQDMQTKKNLEEENIQLKEELERLQKENLELQNDVRRVQELEELYALDTYYKDYPKTGAQIVGLSPNNWYESFIIDKGRVDEIEKYMPVLADNGLAGHVSEVYDHYAKIISVVNKDSYIYGQINRKDGDLVAVQGARGYSSPDTGAIDEDLCMIQFVTNDIDITVGDEIVTSSLGDIYPPGLRIGTVIEIKPLGTGYESLAYVKPVVNLEQLDTVLVITEIWKQDMQKEIAGDQTP